MSKQIITLTFESEWQAKFEVDVEKAAPACRESLEFFGAPITRDDDSDEAAVKEFLQFWGGIIVAASQSKTVLGIISFLANREGIFPLDGTQGVKLIECDRWSFEPDRFEVEVQL